MDAIFDGVGGSGGRGSTAADVYGGMGSSSSSPLPSENPAVRRRHEKDEKRVPLLV